MPGARPLRFALLERFEAIEVTMAGDIEASSGVEGLQEGLRRARERNLCRVLLDIRQTRSVGTFIDEYEAAKNLRIRSGMTQAERCAVVFDPGRYPPTRASTMEATASNWGNPPLAFFSDRAAALRWLCGP